MPIVRVAIDVPLSTLFDYIVDEAVEPGQRVIVPFRRRQMVGVVMECTSHTDVALDRIKPVVQVLRDCAPLSVSLLKLMRFCSDYYRYPIGQTVLSALPTRLRSDKPVTIKPLIHYRLTDDEPHLDSMSARKLIARSIVEKLTEHACSLAQLKTLSASAGTQLKWLEQQGWVESFDAISQPSLAAAHSFANAHELTAEQQVVVDRITQSSGYGCFLLHGITGSGKTEVYVHLMDYVLRPRPEFPGHRCGQILLLVPEINLTPQLEGYFLSRFPDASLVSLHSGLSEN